MKINYKPVIFAFLVAVLITACGEPSCVSSGVASSVHSVEPKPAEEEGCTYTTPLTNEEIIRDTKYCTDAGLGAQAYHCGDNPFTVHIECTPTSAVDINN